MQKFVQTLSHTGSNHSQTLDAPGAGAIRGGFLVDCAVRAWLPAFDPCNVRHMGKAKAGKASSKKVTSRGRKGGVKEPLDIGGKDGREDDGGGHARAVIGSLLAQQPGIEEVQRGAYAALLGPVQADELGKKTRAADVLADAVRWAVQMDADLRKYPAALRYSRARFAFFLESVKALEETIGATEERQKKISSRRDAAGEREAAAKRVRDELVEALRTFAGRRPDERAALEEALGQTDSTEKLLVSLNALRALGQSWLKRDDDVSRVLLAEAGIDGALLARVREATMAVRDAATGATVEGRARVADPPEVNRIEGRVLFEMKEARRIWNGANARIGLVQKLTPSPSIRHAFDRAGRTDDPSAPPLQPGTPAPTEPVG